jgi:hypothetical protein
MVGKSTLNVYTTYKNIMKHKKRVYRVFSELGAETVLTLYILIKFQVDLQADKSSVVVKGPFFPQV